MVFSAILAGGIGSRMHSEDLPKQFLPLGDSPILIRTAKKFLACKRLDMNYVGIPADWIDYTRDLFKTYIPGDLDRIRLVAGGSDRNGTILNIISQIEKDYGESEEHILVSHDAVRPFLTQRMLEENIDGAIAYGATDTVMPSVDTIVISEDKQVISTIPDRSKMFLGQTPQSFRMNLLRDLDHSLTEEENASLTDACKVCVVRNYPVHLIMGEYSNMKITTPADYAIAQAMVAANPQL